MPNAQWRSEHSGSTGRSLAVPPLSRKPELIPVMVVASLLEGGEVAEACFAPELAALFKTTLLPAARRFNGAAADRPTMFEDLFVAQPLGLLLEIVLLLEDSLTGRSFGHFQVGQFV